MDAVGGVFLDRWQWLTAGCIPLTGLSLHGAADPGRRFALPWADLLRPGAIGGVSSRSWAIRNREVI